MKWLLGFSLVLFTVSMAFAADRTLEISFSYTPPSELTATEYKLQQDGLIVCTIPIATIVEVEPGISSLECEFETDTFIHNYTLTATHSDGSTSPPSPEYAYKINAPSTMNFKAKGRFKIRATVYVPDPNI